MKTTKKGIVVQVVTLITFLTMIVVNVLANLLPINGVRTNATSDSYPNLFAPAGFTFSIWAVIYILLALYTLYQLGLFRQEKSLVSTGLLQKVGILFSISSLINAAWIFAWHYDQIPLSMLLMVMLLACLILITQTIKKESLSRKEAFLIKLPFSLYFGWITVATVANATVLLVSLGWDGFGISAPVWAITILIVAALIGIVTMLRNKDIAYGVVFVWAYFGILMKHILSSGFAGQYPAVIATIIACLVLLVATLVCLGFMRRQANV